MTQEFITMTAKELSRHEVVTKLIAGHINGSQAAKQLNLSVRQVKRLKAKVKKFGLKGLIHANRGNPSNRRIDPQIIQEAKKYIKQQYSDFKPTFAAEKLEENHAISLSPEKVRQLMVEENLWQVRSRKKNKEYRSWRPRKEYFGQMIQFDGSYHMWFEDRADESCLLATIDDATGKIIQAEFTEHEGVIAAFSFWKRYVQSYGKPMSIYLDRNSTYKINAKSLFDNPKALTQFERAMKDLDIEVIHAYSAPAKGRIERLFGTLQDRLIKELRLAQIDSKTEANRFLDEVFIQKFNDKFGVLAQKDGDLHRNLTQIETEKLEQIFSIQNKRKVNNDFTIRYKGKWYQLSEVQPTMVYRKDTVLIEERIDRDRTMLISLRDKYLNYEELPERPKRVKMRVTALSKEKQTWKPPADHPWRKQRLNPYKLTVEQLMKMKLV